MKPTPDLSIDLGTESDAVMTQIMTRVQTLRIRLWIRMGSVTEAL